MARQDFIVALDLGTSKVSCCIGEVAQKRDLTLVGRAWAPHRGMRRGVVLDIDEVTQAIRKSVREAENQAGVTISNCFVSLSGDFLKSINSRGTVAISHGGKEILESDVRRVVDTARVVGIPTAMEVIHVIPRDFIVDGHDGIRNPVGMHGLRLEVETHIVTGSTSFLNNIKKCLEGAELELANAGMVASAIASGLAVLQEEEKDLGVAVVDIGAGTSDFSIFKNGHIAHTAVLPVGGSLVTFDIATALKLLPTEAERVKLEYGAAMPESIDEDATIEVSTLSGSGIEEVSRRELAEVIQLRLMDVFEWMKKEMDKAASRGARAASVVVTGGTALMEDVGRLAEKVLELPVRIGYPESIPAFPGPMRQPQFSTVAGLLMYGYAMVARRQQQKRTVSRVKDMFSRVLNVLEEIF